MDREVEYQELAKQVVNLLNENLQAISKFKYERFKNFFLLHVELPNALLNITIKDMISVDLDSKLRQYTMDFYDNTIHFKNFNLFETYFRSLDNSLVDRKSGIFVEYNNEIIKCDVEITSFDSDRQMGLEVLYEVKFYDDESEEEITACEVSEYPAGFFSIYDSNPDVIYDESEVLGYFQKQNQTGNAPMMDF